MRFQGLFASGGCGFARGDLVLVGALCFGAGRSCARLFGLSEGPGRHGWRPHRRGADSMDGTRSAEPGWRAAEGGAAVCGASGAERTRRPWMAAAAAQRSAGHGWPKKQGSHGWRPRLHRGQLRFGLRKVAASRFAGRVIFQFSTDHQRTERLDVYGATARSLRVWSLAVG